MNKRCVKESQIFSGHLGEFFGFSEIIVFHIFVLESRSNFVNTKSCPPQARKIVQLQMVLGWEITFFFYTERLETQNFPRPYRPLHREMDT